MKAVRASRKTKLAFCAALRELGFPIDHRYDARGVFVIRWSGRRTRKQREWLWVSRKETT